jgi:hypothetical protein
MLLITSFPLISFHGFQHAQNVLTGDTVLAGVTVSDWQFHVAAIGIIITWVINLFLVGKIPKFGKYVHMMTAVASNLFNFFVAYVSLVIAFALSFVVLFPSQTSLDNFLTAPIKIIAMMTGELEYNSIIYPSNQIITMDLNGAHGNGSIKSEVRPLDYPITGQVLLAVFVIIVSIVIMNLLIGTPGMFHCRNSLILSMFLF